MALSDKLKDYYAVGSISPAIRNAFEAEDWELALDIELGSLEDLSEFKSRIEKMIR